MDKLGTQRSDGVHGLAIFADVQTQVILLAPAVAAGLNACKHNLQGIQAQGLCIRCGSFQLIIASVPPVIQENGVGILGIRFLIVHEGRVRAVEFILVTDAARGIYNRVIPLDVQAGVPHLLHECLVERNIGGGDRFFLVDEETIEAIVLAHLNELLCIGEAAVLVLGQELGMLQTGTGQEDTADGQHAVLMGGVGVAGVGHVDEAKLELTVLPGIGNTALVLIHLIGDFLGGHPVPRAVVVGILPEVEQILAELVGVGIAVEECVAIVAGQGEPLGFGAQVRVSLGCGQGSIAVLQRNLRTEHITPGVGFRAPVQEILGTVAMLVGLIFASGALSQIREGITGHCERGRACRHQNSQERSQRSFASFQFTLPPYFLRPSRKSHR